MIKWDVQGLRSQQKRPKILSHLKRVRIDAALLQETHLAEGDFQWLKKWWVSEVAGSTTKGKKPGTIILINKRFPSSITVIRMLIRVTITLTP